MSKDKKSTAEQTPDLSNLMYTAGGSSNLIGEKISINLKFEPFFRIGDIDLTPTRYWTTVSANMPGEYYDVITKGLKCGAIVRGKKYIHPVDQNEKVMENWLKLMKVHGRSEITVEALKQLISKNGEGGWSLKEIVTECLKAETNGLHRLDTIELLKNALQYVDPRYREPEVVEEEEGKISITRMPDGSLTMKREDDGSKEDFAPQPPKGYVPGNKDAGSTLDEMLK